jgi:conjugative transfer pilus assembly protein TraH
MTSLPVLKFLVVLNSTQYASGADIESYSTLIATEVLQKYLSGLLQAVNLTSLGSSMPEELMKDLRGRIEVAMTQASKIEPNIGRKFSEKMSLIENVARIEKQLASSLGGQV